MYSVELHLSPSFLSTILLLIWILFLAPIRRTRFALRPLFASLLEIRIVGDPFLFLISPGLDFHPSTESFRLHLSEPSLCQPRLRVLS